MGFIETPYREVSNGKVDLTGKISYLTAEEEDNSYIAQANVPNLKTNGQFVENTVKARYDGGFSS